MLDFLEEVMLDGLLDVCKLLPFLFLTYLLMEWIEHKGEEKTVAFMKKAGPFGPLFGGAIGIVPQCGFSAAAANLYTGRVISVGTLIAVFLSTSDEMLPILLTGNVVPLRVTLTLVAVKAIVGIGVGFLVDFIVSRFENKDAVHANEETQEHEQNEHHHHEHEVHIAIDEICEHDHCHCEKGVLHSAVHHTLTISGFILLVNLLIGTAVFFLGEEFIGSLFEGRPLLGILLALVVGIVPNCAASVTLTELFAAGVLSGGALLAGLLPGAGVGVLVLFRVNHHRKQNLVILATLLLTGLVIGGVFDLTGLSALLF